MRRKYEYFKVTLVYSECKAVNKEAVWKTKLKNEETKQNKNKQKAIDMWGIGIMAARRILIQLDFHCLNYPSKISSLMPPVHFGH